MKPTCTACGGSGWVICERNGLSGASRCECSAPPRPSSGRPGPDEILRVVANIAASGVIPFFPQTEEAWFMISDQVAGFVSDRANLELFAAVIRRDCKKYEGAAGLREIYCRYAEPADGHYPGEDPEARHRRREMHENDQRRLEQYAPALKSAGQMPRSIEAANRGVR
jgi:hypothetical protein